jgi:hypothetical protein
MGTLKKVVTVGVVVGWGIAKEASEQTPTLCPPLSPLPTKETSIKALQDVPAHPEPTVNTSTDHLFYLFMIYFSIGCQKI